MSLLTILLVVVAVAGSLVYNRRVWRPRQAADRLAPDGLNITEVAVPLVTLAALLMVFVLVQVFGSWSAAGRAETTEATATLLLFRQAELLHGRATRARVRRQVVCYATSVIEQEWPAMAREQVSNVPSYWSSEIRRPAVRQARGGRFADAAQEFVNRDGDRASGRQERLGEARPSVPSPLYVLMLLTVAATLAIMGVVTARIVSPGVHLVVVVVSALAFGATLLLIRALDHPYSGLTGREPSQTILVRAQMARDAPGRLPCDDRGLPTRDPTFRPATFPLR